MSKKLFFLILGASIFIFLIIFFLFIKKTPPTLTVPSAPIPMGLLMTTPTDGSINISPSSNISMTFSDPVEESSIKFAVFPNASFIFKSQTSNTFVFEPENNLQPNVTYRVTLTSPIQYAWSFKTRYGGAGEDINYIRAAEADKTGSVAYQKLMRVRYLMEKLPYKGAYFTLSFDNNIWNFVLTLQSAYQQQGNQEFDLFLRANGIDDRSWLEPNLQVVVQ